MTKAHFTLAALVLSSTGCFFDFNNPAEDLPPGVIAGRVVDAQGEALPGIVAALEGLPVTQRTDEKGRFAFNGVPAGTWNLEVRRQSAAAEAGVFDLQTRRVGIELGESEGRWVGDLRLEPAGHFAGVVRLEGQPLAENAGIQLLIPGRRDSALSDDRGRLEIGPLPAGDHALVAVYPGYRAERILVSLEPGARQDFGEHTLERIPANAPPETGAVGGAVRLEGQGAHEGVTLRLASQVTLEEVAVIQSDSEGAYRFEAIPAGVYTLFAEQSDFQRAAWPNVAVAPGGEVALELTLVPTLLLLRKIGDCDRDGIADDADDDDDADDVPDAEEDPDCQCDPVGRRFDSDASLCLPEAQASGGSPVPLARVRVEGAASAREGVPLRVDGGASIAFEGEITTWLWSARDSEGSAPFETEESGRVMRITPRNPGELTISLRVSDGKTTSTPSVLRLQIAPQDLPPVASLALRDVDGELLDPLTIPAELEVIVDASGTMDPEGLSLDMLSFDIVLPNPALAEALERELPPWQRALRFVDIGAFEITVLAGDALSEGMFTLSGTAVAPDVDGDGATDQRFGGDDCDDADETRAPGLAELCNAQDDDCDGAADEGFDLGAACEESRCAAGTRICGESGTAVCEVLPFDAGTPCDDGLVCTDGDTCDGLGGCTAGPPLACEVDDAQCQSARCDNVLGGCIVDNLPDGVACTADSNCAAQPSCQAGACAVPSCTLTVEALHPAAPDWNDYALAADGTVACTGAERGHREVCVHGGEAKVVRVPGETECTGLSMQDALGAFRWVCEDNDGVRFVTRRLAPSVRLADLFEGSDFLENHVSLRRDGVEIEASRPARWWSNPIHRIDEVLRGASTLAGLSGVDTDGNPSATPATWVADATLAGSVLVVESDLTSRGMLVDADAIAVVVRPEAKWFIDGDAEGGCDHGGVLGGSFSTCVLGSADQSFLWIEGYFDSEATGDDTVELSAQSFSVVRHAEIRSGDDCLRLGDSFGLRVEEVALERNIASGISINNVTDSLFHGVTCTRSGNPCLRGGNNRRLAMTRWRFHTAFDDLARLFDTDQVTMVDWLLTGNADDGLQVTGRANTITHVTAMSGAISGARIRGDNNVLMSAVLGANEAGGDGNGLLVSDGEANRFINLAVAHNDEFGFELRTAPGTRFEENLLFGANDAGNCTVDVNSDVNLDTETSCDGIGPEVRVSFGIDLSFAFVGRITNDAASPDVGQLGSNGEIDYGDINDWAGFANRWRGYSGHSGTAERSAVALEHRGDCRNFSTTKLCGLWDWRLVNNGSNPLYKTILTGTDTTGTNFVPGETCPAAASGNLTVTNHSGAEVPGTGGNEDGVCDVGETCEPGETFLMNARELFVEELPDGVLNSGDNDGLCESGEACLFAPNFGAYQGERAIHGPCIFDHGTVRDVKLYAHERFGVPAP